MRHGFTIELIEARRGSLDGLAQWLEANGYAAVPRRPGDLGREAPCARLRLVEVSGETSAARLAEVTRRGPNEPLAIAAMAPEADEAVLSKALAIGPDDLLAYPFDEDELRGRLDALQQLGRCRKVLAERRATFARFMPPAGDGRASAKGARPRHQTATADRPRVLVIGPASQHKVKVGEALARTAINYADNLEKARGALDAGGFDMVVLLGTSPAARRDVLRWPEHAEASRLVSLLVLDPASQDDTLEIRQKLAVLPVADRLVLPRPAELVRARMDFWIAFARLQRQLSSPPEGQLAALCHDGLTGLFNHGYFMEHLRALDLAPPHRRGMVVIELVNLARLNEKAGHAAVNRYLAALGPSLRQAIRADDLAAYLGAGRFAVLFDDMAWGSASRTGARIEQHLAAVPQPAGTQARLTARSFELGPKSQPLQMLHEAMRWRMPPAVAA